MTFAESLNSIEAATSAAELGTVKCAAKRSSMFGYVFKFTHSRNTLTALTTSGDYYISMVRADGVQYIFQYSSATGKFTYKGCVADSSSALDSTTAPDDSESLSLDGELMGHVGIGTDWSENTQSVLDELRTDGPGEW